jgi:3-hydroxybutyryl-CoA dehydrogenase
VFIDKLLEKDVKKEKYSAAEAEAGKSRVKVIGSYEEFKNVDMVIEVS